MSESDWQPTASIETLRRRAAVIADIRHFFAARDVLEVETPLLCRYTVTDPHMPVISARNPCGRSGDYFLQTSPEYAMKRLLAAGSGAIFQISKAFRRGEISARHNPEFSMLEWYRPGFSLTQLMAEVEALVAAILSLEAPARRWSYRQVFQRYLALDPFAATAAELELVARQCIDIQMQSDNADDWLDLLMATVIEPKLAAEGAVFIYNYPASQAALARREHDDDGILVGRRFELYVNGLELANGYDELTDAGEQAARFEAERCRLAQEEGDRAADEFLLQALRSGLPEASGVALGLDRLLMLALGKTRIDEVQAFSAERS